MSLDDAFLGYDPAVRSDAQALAHRFYQHYMDGGKAPESVWRRRLNAALTAVRDTFPEERRAHALKDYAERHAPDGAPTWAIATDTIALLVWARLRPTERVPFGLCLEETCRAMGVQLRDLPRPPSTLVTL